MRRTLLLIAVAALAGPVLFAQSRPFNLKASNGPYSTRVRPMRVSGEGISTPSGAKYWDMATGKGNPATRGHVVRVLYREWVENGREIETSISADKPTIFTLGMGQVIRAWEEGMEGIRAGGSRQIRVPADLAYGAAGVLNLVPPNANLIIDVFVLAVD